MTKQPKPQTFPTEGPRSMRFTAYDPNRFDVCSDPDCKCRSGKGSIRGFGETEQEALADFWEQWGEADAMQQAIERAVAVLQARSLAVEFPPVLVGQRVCDGWR